MISGCLMVLAAAVCIWAKRRRSKETPSSCADMPRTSAMPQPHHLLHVPEEKTYTFEKPSVGTFCGIIFRTEGRKVVTSIISLDRKGAAADCGLKVGDVVLTINGSDVTSDSQATMLLKEAESVITMRVTRLIVRKSAGVEMADSSHALVHRRMSGSV